MNQPPEDCQLGLHLPDEACYFPLALRRYACPWCGCNVQINRLGAFRYQIICGQTKCGYRTGTYRYSQEAVKEFRVTAVLHQR